MMIFLQTPAHLQVGCRTIHDHARLGFTALHRGAAAALRYSAGCNRLRENTEELKNAENQALLKMVIPKNRMTRTPSAQTQW
jgi:hypothetical protein